MLRTNEVNRWMLPDGIGEVLPPQAAQIEALRRQLLDLYSSWGYELIIPPLLEFTESLLVSTNRDLDLQTFKVTDQLSGRTMGLRADITPQAARIDAHSLNRQGAVRLCYAGSVLHTRPNNALASRSPIQLGVECFGLSDAMADSEVMSLMIETLQSVGVEQFVLSLGHVDIFRALVEQADLSVYKTDVLLDILQRKAQVELEGFIAEAALPAELKTCLPLLLSLNGGVAVLAEARSVLPDCGARVQQAIVELEEMAAVLLARYPQVKLQIDLAEVPGYQYHKGLVFAAYVEGCAAAIANGGRYDGLSELFGRSRPATGFNADLKALVRLGQPAVSEQDANMDGVITVMNADKSEAQKQWQAISDLRASGKRVVCLPASEPEGLANIKCNQKLILKKDQYVVVDIAE